MDAALIQALTADQLVVRLDQRSRLLGSGSRAALPRQQTLQATLDWSYALLTKPERRQFERLAVFAGHWTLEAAEALGDGPGLAAAGILDLLPRLVSKSLVVASAGDDGLERYALLETLRDYARQKLLARGVAETASPASDTLASIRMWLNGWGTSTRILGGMLMMHGDDSGLYPATIVRSIWNTGAPAPAGFREQIDEVADNVRAAVQWWSEVGRPTEGLRLAAVVAEYGMWRGRTAEARRWLDPMRDLDDRARASAGIADRSSAPAHFALRARSRFTLAILTAWSRNYIEACSIVESAVALARESLEPRDVNAGLAVLGLTLALTGADARAATVLDDSLRLSREVDDHHGTALRCAILATSPAGRRTTSAPLHFRVRVSSRYMAGVDT